MTAAAPASIDAEERERGCGRQRRVCSREVNAVVPLFLSQPPSATATSDMIMDNSKCFAALLLLLTSCTAMIYAVKFNIYDSNLFVKELPAAAAAGDDSKPAAGPSFDVRIYNQDFLNKLNFSFEEILPKNKVRDWYNVYDFKTGSKVGKFSKSHRFVYDLDTWYLERWRIVPVL